MNITSVSSRADSVSSDRSGKSSERTSGGQKMKKPATTIHKEINAADYMYRIASARTPSRVMAIIRIARADMQFVKKSGAPVSDVAKAEKILKRVISKSRLKIKRLKTEKELEQQQKLAENAKKEKLQKEIAEKLHKKRRSRTAQEAADVADPERVDIRPETETLAPPLPDSLAAAPAIDLMAEGMPAVETSAVDVTL